MVIVMSAFTIYYKDGAKMMRPVLSHHSSHLADDGLAADDVLPQLEAARRNDDVSILVEDRLGLHLDVVNKNFL